MKIILILIKYIVETTKSIIYLYYSEIILLEKSFFFLLSSFVVYTIHYNELIRSMKSFCNWNYYNGNYQNI